MTKTPNTLRAKFQKLNLTPADFVDAIVSKGISRASFYRDLAKEITSLPYDSLKIYSKILNIKLDQLVTVRTSKKPKVSTSI